MTPDPRETGDQHNGPNVDSGGGGMMRHLTYLLLAATALSSGAALAQTALPDDAAARLAAIERENSILRKENAALRERSQLQSDNAKLRDKVRSQESSRESSREASRESPLAREWVREASAVPPAASGPGAAPSALAGAIATTPVAPPGAASLHAYAAAPAYPGFSWAGPYAGVSLGLGWLHATTSTSDQATTIDTVPSFLPLISDVRTITGSDAFNGRGKFSAGAVGDIYVGHNFQVNNWIAGVQLEGSLGRFSARVKETGAGTTTAVTQAFIGAIPIGPAHPSDTITRSASETVGVNINFMASVLARVGYLFGPTDLAYGLVGWTYAGFDATLPNSIDPSFGASGLTVGLGWERQVMANWTLKAEYRYTKFQDVTLTSQSISSFSTDPNFGTGKSTSTSSTRISPDLQVLRVGLTRYFGDEGPLSSYAADFSKAPAYYKAPAHASWTGLYGGLSVGVGGMVPNATTDSSSVQTTTQTPLGQLSQFATVTNSDSAAGDKMFKPGGAVDLFVGYNYQTSPNFVAGVQLEGSVARFNEQLTRTVTSSLTEIFTGPNPGSFSQSTTFTANDTLKVDWMLTALARLGYLVDPGNLVYLLGGWTYAGFDTTLERGNESNRTFTARGPTVGAGWERQLWNAWTFRAEYRYTKFQDVTLRSRTSSSRNEVTPLGTNSDIIQTTSSTGISSDMHLVRLGIARAFGPW
jgi:outer membrane immunogenic protein